MPEFILDHGSHEATTWLALVDAFTGGYVEAMYFTETGDRDDEDLEHATVGELSIDARNEIASECRQFQAINAHLLDLAYQRDGYDEAAAGRDFWFTRNGHGVGFWTRDALEEGGLGEALSAACGWRTEFGEVDLYRGDDGQLCLMEG